MCRKRNNQKRPLWSYLIDIFFNFFKERLFQIVSEGIWGCIWLTRYDLICNSADTQLPCLPFKPVFRYFMGKWCNGDSKKGWICQNPKINTKHAFVCFVHTSQGQVIQWLCTFWLTLPCAQMRSTVVLFESAFQAQYFRLQFSCACWVSACFLTPAPSRGHPESFKSIHDGNNCVHRLHP